MKLPELLSPAGTRKAMDYAFAYGADAVYAGQPRYSLRVRNNEFNVLENILEGIEEAHRLGKKFLIASNILPHNNKVKSYLRHLEPVVEARPDALIMADPGLIMMVREKWPEQEIHLSVQMNTLNYAAVKFWKKMGIARIILSRELSLGEVQEIREECPDVELETFVHGALCMAYSGRCLLSGYFNHRDANQGACTNACRWKYQLHEAKEDEFGNLKAVTHCRPEVKEKVFVLQEATRKEELIPVYEDESGTHIMNSKDLRAIQHVDQLIKMGIDCLKIEGRTKTPFYVARTTQLYRRAIDDAIAGKPFDVGLMDALEGLSSRGFTEGFYRRHVRDELQEYESRSASDATQKFVGEVIDFNPNTQMLKIDVRNHFEVGDKIELMTTEGNERFTLAHIENEKGVSVDVAPGSGHVVHVPYEGSKPLEKAMLIKFG
jgi:U32 family peptidase